MRDEGRPFEELLEHGLDELGFPDTLLEGSPPSPARACAFACALLQKYIEEIELFNEAYGLVKVTDRRELIIKHVLDSLAPLKTLIRLRENNSGVSSNLRFAEAWRIADVGSGAGFPGIPLAICLPKAEFTLIERMEKRAGFLRDCIAVLGIGNVTVEEIEMEKAAPGRFDMAVFRAFRPLEPRILKGLLRLLKPGGFLAAWKGRLENSREEMTAAERSFPGLQWEIHPITVPFLEEERHLTVIRTE